MVGETLGNPVGLGVITGHAVGCKVGSKLGCSVGGYEIVLMISRGVQLTKTTVYVAAALIKLNCPSIQRDFKDSARPVPTIESF